MFYSVILIHLIANESYKTQPTNETRWHFTMLSPSAFAEFTPIVRNEVNISL